MCSSRVGLRPLPKNDGRDGLLLDVGRRLPSSWGEGFLGRSDRRRPPSEGGRLFSRDVDLRRSPDRSLDDRRRSYLGSAIVSNCFWGGLEENAKSFYSDVKNGRKGWDQLI